MMKALAHCPRENRHARPPCLLLVLRQFAVSVAMLVPVIPAAFVCMPMNLGGHPGEPPDSSAAVARCVPLDRARSEVLDCS